MKEVTHLLINDFKIRSLNHDFMGYSLQKGDIYTFHHLLIPARNGGPYSYNNGVVLTSTSHQYLHTIEAVKYRYFAYLTSEMQEMKLKGLLSPENLRNIDEILQEFEFIYSDAYTRKGKKLIRTPYLNRKHF